MTIGLYSPAPQSGKSTVAQYLFDQGFVRKGFADSLRDMTKVFLFNLGFHHDEVRYFVHDGVGKETPIPEIGGKTPRYLMQTLGTEWGRELIDRDLWVKATLHSRRRPPLLVIDDLRFPNEYQAIKDAGGEVWRIYRPGREPTNGHPSEGLLEGLSFDENIINRGTLEDLRVKAEGALRGPF